jgi:hypothetical protein
MAGEGDATPPAFFIAPASARTRPRGAQEVLRPVPSRIDPAAGAVPEDFRRVLRAAVNHDPPDHP